MFTAAPLPPLELSIFLPNLPLTQSIHLSAGPSWRNKTLIGLAIVSWAILVTIFCDREKELLIHCFRKWRPNSLASGKLCPSCFLRQQQYTQRYLELRKSSEGNQFLHLRWTQKKRFKCQEHFLYKSIHCLRHRIESARG